MMTSQKTLSHLTDTKRDEHGSRGSYVDGCRCYPCIEANREYMREYMRRYRAKGQA